MVYEYFQNSVQLSVNELCKVYNYLMITLKTGKTICPVCDVKNSNIAFRR